MELKDIKVGMRVIPINKTTGIDMDEWKRFNRGSWNYFKENGYLDVIEIYGGEIVECGVSSGNGVDFLPTDLIPYIEKESARQEDTYLQSEYNINPNTRYRIIYKDIYDIVLEQKHIKKETLDTAKEMIGTIKQFNPPKQVVINTEDGLQIIHYKQIVSMEVAK